jgi:hypothetical protein
VVSRVTCAVTRTLRISCTSVQRCSRFCSCSWSADQPSAANHVRVSDPAAGIDGSAASEQEQEKEKGQVENRSFELWNPAPNLCRDNATNMILAPARRSAVSSSRGPFLLV